MWQIRHITTSLNLNSIVHLQFEIENHFSSCFLKQKTGMENIGRSTQMRNCRCQTLPYSFLKQMKDE